MKKQDGQTVGFFVSFPTNLCHNYKWAESEMETSRVYGSCTEYIPYNYRFELCNTKTLDCLDT